MKRLVTAALAAATFIAPMTAAAPAFAREHGNYRGRDDDGWRGRDRHDRGDRYDRGDRHDRYDRGRDRRNYREWDRRSHNGYNYRGQWHYGPPPQAYYSDPYYNPGYRAWRRGDRLPPYYYNSYRGVDWRYRRLHEPPRGYRYVEDDRGEVLLVAIATGIILSVIAGY